jgi:hypothetical protein
MAGHAPKTPDFDADRNVFDIVPCHPLNMHDYDPGRPCRGIELWSFPCDDRPLQIQGTFDQPCDMPRPFGPQVQSVSRGFLLDEVNELLERDKDGWLGPALFVRYVACIDAPLYSLEDLEELVGCFTAHLQHNRRTLLATGHPIRSFGRSPWLDDRLTRLYFTKLPVYVRSRCRTDGDFEYEYTWPRQAPDPLAKSDRSGKWAVPYGPHFQYGDDGQAFARDGSPVEAVPYEEAALLGGLGTEDATRLEELRETILDVKTKTLRRLLRALGARDAHRLVDECLRLLVQKLSDDDVALCLRMDRLYYDQWIGVHDQVFDESAVIGGGIGPLLYVVGHFCKEIMIGTLDQTRHALSELMAPDWLGRPRLAVVDYLTTVGRAEQNVIDRAYRRFRPLYDREEEFWRTYLDQVNDVLNKRFRRRVRLEWVVPRLFAEGFERLASEHGDLVLAQFYETSPWPHAPPFGSRSGTRQRQLDGYGIEHVVDPNARWEDVTIAIRSRDSARVTVGIKSAVLTTTALGFIDRRRGDQPTKLWDLLVDFAEHDGRLDARNYRFDPMLKHQVSQLRRHLRRLLKIDSDPFLPYQEMNAYVTRFRILDESYGGSGRQSATGKILPT